MLAIYTRISKEDKNDEGVSLDNQKNRGIQLAKTLNIKYKIYEDDGKSGELPIEKRPSFLQVDRHQNTNSGFCLCSAGLFQSSFLP